MSRSDTRWHIKYKTCLTSGTVLLIRIQMGSGVSNFVWIRIDTGIPNCRYCVLSGPKQLKIREKAGLTYNNCPSLLRTFCACHCLTWKTEIISLNNSTVQAANLGKLINIVANDLNNIEVKIGCLWTSGLA